MDQKLKIGDILLFKPTKNNSIEKCIAKITNSDVCHAAMVYDSNSFIEMNASGVGVYEMKKTEGDAVYVMRMKQQLDPAPLIKSANGYLDAKVRFDFPALVILAGLLVYRGMMPRKDLFDISGKIIKAACVQLDYWLQQKAFQKAPAQICSQLVYQIYENSGPEYKIRIKGGILESDTKDYVQENIVLDGDFSENPITQEELPQRTEELAKELLDIMNTPYKEEGHMLVSTPMHRTFHEKIIKILEKQDIKIMPESLFVMPGDLHKYAQNLEQVEVCNIVRG